MRKGYFKDDVPREERKHFTIKSRPYTLYGEILYKLGLDGTLQRCLSPNKGNVILTELHDGPTRGHYGISTTIKNILTIGYYWPTIQ